ncbi:MAG: 50S ribosomal protein L15 [Planctomycetota bacterium]
MNLHELNQKVDKKPKKWITGRGQGSGHGKSAGRGTRGARAKSGWKTMLYREGGQMPLARRIPKRGFNNAIFRQEFAFVNLRDLNQFDEGSTVTLETLVAMNIVPRPLDGLKVLGHGELEKKVHVKAHRISASARKAIEAKGCTIEIIKVTGDDTTKAWKKTRGQGKSMKRRLDAKSKAQTLKAKQAKK